MLRITPFPTQFITFTISLLLILMFAAPQAPAVEKWRESNFNLGQQWWFESAVYTERVNPNKTLNTAKETGFWAKAKPWWDANSPILSKDDIIMDYGGGGFDANDKTVMYTTYKFEADGAGKAFIWLRCMSTWPINPPRGQQTNSWFVVLNSEKKEDVITYDAPGEWTWSSGRGGDAVSPKGVRRGENDLRLVPREWEQDAEAAADIIMVSTVNYKPNNEDYGKAKEAKLAVDRSGKLATTWGSLKQP